MGVGVWVVGYIIGYTHVDVEKFNLNDALFL